VGISQHLDRHLALEGWECEALGVARRGHEGVDRLRLFGVAVRRGQGLLGLGLGEVPHRHVATPEPQRELLLEGVAQLPQVAGGEERAQVREGRPRLVEPPEEPFDLVAHHVPPPRRHHRQEGRDVEEHRQGAPLRVQRQGQLPLLDEAADGGAPGTLEHALGDPALLRRRDHLGIVRIQDQIALGLHQVV